MDRKLVYDVGAHCGSDTAHYLERGYDVLAIEADPSLAEKLRERFADAVRSARLRVVQCGITDSDGELPFYLCPANSEWNSFNRKWILARGAEAVEITVPARRFESILSEYGTPHFLKVDIEGCDPLCIRALSRDRAPDYVSFEAAESDAELVAHLSAIGYRRFALVNQYDFRAVSIPAIGTFRHLQWSGTQWARAFARSHQRLNRAIKAIRPPRHYDRGEFRNDSAGPCPMDRTDGWQDVSEFMYTWSSVIKSGLLTSSWFDVHAALGRAQA